MNSEPLVRSVLAALLLLENSDDSEVDPDVAVAGMEAISHELQKMTPSDIEEFVVLVERIADSEEEPAYREFYRSVPFALGISA
ncbi:hypothetical protein [Cellulomonas sp. S1-8]|uniref:hypothetical protein n=1 Tax=Cellulomonas sp. S1-8 TaxID=2904790 RepID=UPI00224413C5|nr:hypothetical protein [Cellulomonas sp. S1-8]UZN02628.1 hypothetical protein OKX07_16455 [Cellulomonas sp. S1-8]